MIRTINNEVELASMLSINLHQLDELLINPTYAPFFIPKKKGGTRKIVSPNQQLKFVQQKLLQFFQLFYEANCSIHVHGFSKSTSNQNTHSPIVCNAIPHINKKNILSLDLKDFFESITAKQIFELFRSEIFEFSDRISYILTRLTTFNGTLPTGAPTSPILSNFVFLQKDIVISNYVKSLNVGYTRYADDLTFSSNNLPLNELIAPIQEIIAPFLIQPKKTRILHQNRKQKVTGIIVNKKINVDRQFLKKTRAMLHDYSRNGLEQASKNHFKQTGKESNFLNKLRGNISFIGQVRGKEDYIYLKYQKEFEQKTLLQKLENKTHQN